MKTGVKYPRIKDLPESERQTFSDWLVGQTVPFVQDVAIMEQDGYYPWDYARWKLWVDSK